TYGDLSKVRVQRLRKLINEALKKSNLIKEYKVDGHAKFKSDERGIWAEIRCKAYYFDKRQAVTFERDNFIGFAGWSDPHNVQPILCAFVQWVFELQSAKAA